MQKKDYNKDINLHFQVTIQTYNFIKNLLDSFALFKSILEPF